MNGSLVFYQRSRLIHNQFIILAYWDEWPIQSVFRHHEERELWMNESFTKRNQVNDIFEERDVFCLCIIFNDDDYGWLSNVGSIVVYIILYNCTHCHTLQHCHGSIHSSLLNNIFSQETSTHLHPLSNPLLSFLLFFYKFIKIFLLIL